MTRRAVPPIVLVPLLIVAIVVSTSACGTMANLNDARGGSIVHPAASGPGKPAMVYGGVLGNVELITHPDLPVGAKVLIFPMWLVDITLSAALDTVTLPVVIWMNARKDKGQKTTDTPDDSAALKQEPKPPHHPPSPNLGKLTVAEQTLNPSR